MDFLSHLGMNGLCGILAISHLGGTVDDDDVKHLAIPIPHPITPRKKTRREAGILT